MLSKKAVKDIQSLRLKKGRQETGLFVVEGPKMVNELLRARPQAVQQLFATDAWAPPDPEAVQKLERITLPDLERISQWETPQQVLAVVKQFPQQKPNVKEGLCIYLDTVQDPGNLGSIIRIADWFHCTAVVCSAGCAELYNPKVISATMGSFLRVPVWYDEKGDWLHQQSAPKLAAVLGGTAVENFKASLPAVLLIGNEGNGLSAEVLAEATHKITISKRGGAESLNAAVAAGILVSHLLNGT